MPKSQETMRIRHFLDKNLHLVKKAYTIHTTGCIAQLVEQLTLNQWVQGSSPCASTRNKNHRKVVFLFMSHIRTKTLVRL